MKPRSSITLGNPGALAIELVGGVGRLAQQHEAGIADPTQERIVVRRELRERVGRLAHRVSC
jgi:hypothetical protein